MFWKYNIFEQFFQTILHYLYNYNILKFWYLILYKMLGFGYGHVTSKRFIYRINYKFDNEEKMRDKYGCKIFTFDPRYWISLMSTVYRVQIDYSTCLYTSINKVNYDYTFSDFSDIRVIQGLWKPLIGLKNLLEILKILSNSIEFLWLHEQNTLLKWLSEKPTI